MRDKDIFLYVNEKLSYMFPCPASEYPNTCVNIIMQEYSTLIMETNGRSFLISIEIYFQLYNAAFNIFLRINKSFEPHEEPPYNFRHVLDFTDQDELFEVS